MQKVVSRTCVFVEVRHANRPAALLIVIESREP